MHFLLCCLVVIAGLSPLLTFARLFQMKEWRWDRLREHLRREGWFRQFFGIVRPVVVTVGLFIVLVISAFPSLREWTFVPLWSTWALLAWFTLFRFVVRRQARPVWTAKAVTTVVIALFMYCLIAFLFCESSLAFFSVVAETFLPLFAFAFVCFAWILLLPPDRFLKSLRLRNARQLRSRFKNLAVVGITGSVGKTTTKELLAHLLYDRKLLVTPVHVNTELGVAQVMLQNLSKEIQLLIVEMGAYRRGEIKTLCSLVQPHIGVITCIGKQHLGLFGSQEDLVRAKGELFESLPAEGHAFLNGDTPFSSELMKRAACPVRTVGTGGHATYEAFEIEEKSEGVSFMLRGIQFLVPLHGTHQVTNILLAVAVAEVLGVPLVESAKRLKNFIPPAQTFERKTGASGQIILDDTHNSSPSSFRAAIEWARVHSAKKKLLITSGLLELGKEERAIHTEMGVHARGVFDKVIFLNRRCARFFEQGYGKPVRIFRKKFGLKMETEMLIVCEGRMPGSMVEKLLG